jgi:diguanylate cyclase (GGDEF)-like protein/PAS domain S-box-containing protein
LPLRPKPKLRLRWLTAAAAAICATLLLNALFTYRNVLQLDRGQQSIVEAAELKRELSAVLGTIVDAETAARGYVLKGKPSYLDDLAKARARKDQTLAQVRALVKDDPTQLARLNVLAAAIDQRLALIDEGLGIFRKEGRDAVIHWFLEGRGVKRMDDVREAIADMEGGNRTLFAEMTRSAGRVFFTTVSGLVLFTAASALLLVLVTFFVRREIRLRQRTADTAIDTAQMLRLVVDTIPQRIFWKDRELRYLGCNTLFARDAGRETVADIVGRTDAELYPTGDAARFAAADAKVIAEDTPELDCDEAFGTPDRRTLVRMSKVPLHDAKGQVIGILGAYEDVTERRHAERLLAVRGKALESSVNGILITGAPEAGSAIEYANPALEAITGYGVSELVGRNCRVLQGSDTAQAGLADIRLALKEGRPCNVVLRNYRKDGGLFWNDLTIAPVRDAAGRVTHHIGIVNDITERARYQQELEREANFDSLTGLPNRNLLADRLDQMLAHAQHTGSRLAVVMLDMDNFKFVNDSMGHHAGDALLAQIAARLRDTMRADDTVARYAGDEFVLVLGECPNDEAVSALMTRVLVAMSEPLVIAETRLSVSCSMGISIYPGDGADAQTLLRHADLALYRAKENGRNNFEFFEPGMSRRVHERMWLARDLRAGLEQGQFFLHYQPQVDIATGAIVGAEALARWLHPTQGNILPGRFIPAAEDSAFIMPMGEWILEAACRQCARWHGAGLPPIRVSVNLSALQIRQRGFIDVVSGVLQRTDLAPQYLELEVTESLLMAHTEEVMRTLDALKAMGIRLAIDDFGTGYSSLNYLKRLPVDRLKIDGSFLKDVPHDTGNRSITLAVIALAKNMGLGVIAEGVENAEQVAFLREHGCDEIQGHHFSKPLPADALAELLRRQPVVPAAQRSA